MPLISSGHVDKPMDGKKDKSKNKIIGKEIFSAGEWNGDAYTVEDLEGVCKAYNETNKFYKPYMKLGHSDKQLLLGSEGLPAAGWVENLRMKGNKLVCDIVDLPEKIYNLIKEGAYKYVSCEMLWGIDFNGKNYKRMLSGVALLGAEMPAVTNLNDFLNLYKLDAKFIRTYTINYVSNEGDNMPIENDPKKEDPKAAPAAPAPKAPVAPAAPVAPMADEKKKTEMEIEVKPEVKPGEEKPEVKPMGGDLEKRLADLEAKLAAMTEKLGQANGEVAKYKATAEQKDIEAFLAEEKIVPAAKEYVRELLGTEKKEYSFGDKKLSKKELVKEVLKIYATTSKVNLVENSSVGDATNSKDEQDKKIDDIKKYAADNKVSFAEAFRVLEADKGDSEDDDSNEEE